MNKKEKPTTYYQINREKILQGRRIYRQANKEKIRAYYQDNKEKILKCYSSRYHATDGKEKKRQHEWAIKNRKKRTEYFRKYRKTKKGREATRRATKKYEQLNKEKRLVWGKAQSLALKPCEVCGDILTSRHHSDYSKPLSVNFLCPLHHKEIHRP